MHYSAEYTIFDLIFIRDCIENSDCKDDSVKLAMIEKTNEYIAEFSRRKTRQTHSALDKLD